ncbi:HNH endonuclease [Flexivirga sp. ID2601S]|uniref:HNH endonuclease n=2 Tax=Flexivirga aerilata TaxID=1656889 RepID=A0A849AK68_9MICO|nr:HNH endonuclease [Flexivirga aerilata]
MPQGWQAHWNPEPRLSPEEAADRDRRVHTLGNLTLVAKSLNGSLSNRPWTDSEASSMKVGGEAGRGKRSLLEKYSLLVLSKDLIHEHPSAWTDADIEARSAKLTDHICELWSGPPTDVEPIEEIEEVRGPGSTTTHSHVE